MLTIGIAGFGWWGRHVCGRLRDHPGIRVGAVAEPVEALHLDIAVSTCSAPTDGSRCATARIPTRRAGVTDWLLCPKGGTPTHEAIDWSDAVVANLEAFAAAVAGRAVYPWTPEQLIGNIAVYEAICQSADGGETVRLA